MKKIGLIILLYIGFIRVATAYYPQTDFDYALLPPFCKARASGDTPEYRLWNNRLGPDFQHIHHYCAGLHTMNVAAKIRDVVERVYQYKVAAGEMAYIEAHAKPDFKIFPKLYFDQGQAWERGEKIDEAVTSYKKSIALYQKSALPYAALSDLYEKKNMKDQAKSILEQGLQHNPNSKPLLKRMKKYQ